MEFQSKKQASSSASLSAKSLMKSATVTWLAALIGTLIVTSAPDARAVTNGKASYDAKFAPVVSYFMLNDAAFEEAKARRESPLAMQIPKKDLKGTSVSCTGTFISPRHMITATHCLHNFKNPNDFYSQSIARFPVNAYRKVDTNGHADTVTHAVRVYSFESYNENVTDFVDVSIIEYPFNQYYGTMPVSFEPLKHGDEVFIAGYGCDKATNEKHTDFKFGTMTVQNTSRFVIGLRKGKTGELCSGDSGGPILKTMPDGTLALVGINSYFNTAAGRFTNSRDRAARIDSATEKRVDLWIQSVLAGSETPIEFK